MTQKKTRAVNSTLLPGQDSIGRVQPRPNAAGTYLMDWRATLADGTKVRHRSQGKTAAECRRRARAKLAALTTASSDGAWSRSSQVSEFITEVCIPELEDSGLSVEKTIKPRKRILTTVATAWRGRTIESVTKGTVATVALLKDVARTTGPGAAESMRSTITRWVMGVLVSHGVLDHNPTAGMRFDPRRVPGVKDTGLGGRGGQALTSDQYREILEWLLALDPADVTVSQPGPARLRAAMLRRQTTIDLTLLCAATGLRISEATALTWDRHISDDGTTITITVTEDISKTGRERTIPIMDDRVSAHIRARADQYPDYPWVVGDPSHRRAWAESTAHDAIPPFYTEMYERFGFEPLARNRSHLWRATLNTLLAPVVPLAVRVAMLGHTKDVNERSYTGRVDVRQAKDALGSLLSNS